MKFLVLGASGMAGHTIAIYLKEHNHDVTGYARRPITFCDSIAGDVNDTQRLQKIISEGEYDVVINCIGILNQYAETSKADAVFLNSYLPHLLTDITKNMKTQIIHMSTDCVFSGKKGNYTEIDFPDGSTFYDRTKAIGELIDDKNITLRTSIIGPDINPDGIGLFNWFMKQSSEINGYTKAMWTGITTLQLAKVMEAAAEKKVYGLYNIVYQDSISKYNLLKLFNQYFKEDSLKINPSNTFVSDKSLKRTKFEFDYIIPDYETMIYEMTEWIKDHKYLYHHYNIVC
jgi:dTDP-4-dehydrorhamnose reductase